MYVVTSIVCANNTLPLYNFTIKCISVQMHNDMIIIKHAPGLIKRTNYAFFKF